MLMLNQLLKYRYFLKKNVKSKCNLINKKYVLICHFNNFNGFGLKLLKLFLIKYKLKFPIYKYLIKINIKNINNNFIYFKFNKFSNILNFIKFIKSLTLIPFLIFPLVILNKYKNILMPFYKINTFNKVFKNLTKIKLINFIFVKFLKTLLINFIFKLIFKIKNANLKSISFT